MDSYQTDPVHFFTWENFGKNKKIAESLEEMLPIFNFSFPVSGKLFEFNPLETTTSGRKWPKKGQMCARVSGPKKSLLGPGLVWSLYGSKWTIWNEHAVTFWRVCFLMISH